jgi:hypothetical protein
MHARASRVAAGEGALDGPEPAPSSPRPHALAPTQRRGPSQSIRVRTSRHLQPKTITRRGLIHASDIGSRRPDRQERGVTCHVARTTTCRRHMSAGALRGVGEIVMARRSESVPLLVVGRAARSSPPGRFSVLSSGSGWNDDESECFGVNWNRVDIGEGSRPVDASSHHESRSGRYRQLRQQPVISSLILVPASNGSLNKRTSLAELVGCRRPVAAMCLRAREAPQTRPRNSQLEDRWRPSPLQPWRDQDRLGLSLPRGRADCPIR